MANVSRIKLENTTYDIKDEIARNHDNYSTSEQVIGTWINNKPLYRKVIEVNNIVLDTNTTCGNISNISKVVKIDGIITSSTGFNMSIGSIYLSTWNRNNYVWIDSGNGDVKYNIRGDWTTINKMIVIVEYTKSTD